MATLGDIGLSAALNILGALAFFVAFAVLRLQPFNDRVFFPKWYLKGVRSSPTHSGTLRKFVNLDFRSYLRFLQWMPAALKMPEPELIDHAGLDSAVYLRIYLIGLKFFVPIALVAFSILIPVNWTNNNLKNMKLEFSEIDKLSISNVPNGSQRFNLIARRIHNTKSCRNRLQTDVGLYPSTSSAPNRVFFCRVETKIFLFNLIAMRIHTTKSCRNRLQTDIGLCSSTSSAPNRSCKECAA